MGGIGRRIRARAAATIVAVCLLALAAPSAVAVSAPPKVAIIVGPAGTAVTARYRQAADVAAVAAGKLTPNVVRVYSPNATWPAVRAAVTGASVVIYLGHGNGWPSPYSDQLMSRTQNGFGLNPVAGVDDVAHQYYGEAYISKLHLAPDAVVLLSHLCYASGSAEPGLADGTFDQVLARVDGFASGFLAAGAATVVAEGHSDPAALIGPAIRGSGTLARAWTSAAWGHGHMAAYTSTRTPGARITLDPDTADGGWYRSLVQASGSAAAPRVVSPMPVTPSGPPSLASSGARFGTAAVDGSVLPGSTATLKLPVTRNAADLPASMSVGLRWLPLVASQADPGATSTDDGLVVGEASADVVESADARLVDGTLVLAAPTPRKPGTYVVLLTIATADGTPYDVATQALLRPFTVVVPKPVDLRIDAPASADAAAGEAVRMTVELTNTGTQTWGSTLYTGLWDDPSLEPWMERYLDSILVLTATWLDPATGVSTPAASYDLPRTLAVPGHAWSVNLAVRAPDAVGRYILVLSVAARGSLGEYPQDPLLVPAVVR